jgi:capsular polysaccharide biosynthesis protein
LNTYVEFIKKKTIIEFKNRLKLTLMYEIDHLKHEIEIVSNFQKEEITYTLENLEHYKSFKFLTKELLMYEKIFLKLESEKLDYDHVIDNSILTENKTDKSSLKFIVSGFFFGMFLSISIIFFKNYSKLLTYKKN